MAQTVGEIMTWNPTSPSVSMTVAEPAPTMRDRGIGDVIVLDDNSTMCGIVTDRDVVVRAVAEDKLPNDVHLGDVCSRELTTVEVDTPVRDAVQLMRDEALRCLPVVEHGRPAGIVSLGDLAIERESKSVLADISAAPSNT